MRIRPFQFNTDDAAGGAGTAPAEGADDATPAVDWVTTLRSLEEITGRGARHVSGYLLEIHPETRFGRDVAAGRESLATIAAEYGFSDQSHMTRQFRSFLGTTPGALRRTAGL